MPRCWARSRPGSSPPCPRCRSGPRRRHCPARSRPSTRVARSTAATVAPRSDGATAPSCCCLARLGLRARRGHRAACSTTSTGTPVACACAARVRASASLPLPADVGEAIAAYLQKGGPAAATAICSCAPARRSAASCTAPYAVGSIVRTPWRAPASMRRTRAHTSSATPWPSRMLQRRRLADRDRRAPAPPQSAVHVDLRPGGYCSLARAGAAMAGRCAMNTLAMKRCASISQLRRSLGFKLHDAGLHAAAVRRLPRRTIKRAHHRAAGLGVGAAVGHGAACRVGAPAGLRPRLRSLPQRQRRPDRDPAQPDCCRIASTRATALPVHGAGSRTAAGGGTEAAHGVAIDEPATAGVPLPARLAQRDRSAHFRGAASASRRCRSRPGAS